MKNISYLWQNLEPKFFVCPGVLQAKGRRDLNVLGNCIKCIDCDTRVSVVPPGALVSKVDRLLRIKSRIQISSISKNMIF